MVIRYNDLVHVITTLADEENITVAVKETLKGSLIAGGACALGALVLGPPGLAIGGAYVGACLAIEGAVGGACALRGVVLGFAITGAVGGGIAYCLAKDKFKPLSHVILYEMR